MRTETQGWVIVRHGEKPWVLDSTFKYTRSEAIKEFLHGTPRSWRWFKRKYGYKAVKATRTTETI